MTDAVTNPIPWLDLLASLASLAGAAFFLASAIGLWRLPDFYTRLHAPTKAATLGVALLAAGSLLAHLGEAPGSGGAVWLEDLVLIAFLFLTVPLSAQMLARAAAARGVASAPQTRGEPPAAE